LALADGPEIANVVVDPTSITSTSATIFWTTNTSSDSVVHYGNNCTSLGTTVSDSSLVTTHFIGLTGLTPGTTYYFEVESTDASGTSIDNNSDACYQFTTLAPATYSITLNPACGVCGDLYKPVFCNEVIEVTATVSIAGTYYICWDSRSAWNPDQAKGVVMTFEATAPGAYISTFFMPVAKKGLHDVYLTNAYYDDLGTGAHTTFEVFPSAKIDYPVPAEGPVGTTVILKGYGFTASQEVRVTLFQGEVKKGEEKTTTTDSYKGNWTISYTIPPTPAGGYIFKVEAKDSTMVWVNWLNKYFKVTPSITPNTSSGKVGQTIEVSGKGFASKEEGIEVTFDGKVVKKNIPPADENGSWSTVIVVPPCQ